MCSWLATAFGALDLTQHAFKENGYELLLVPTVPGAPVFLTGAGAEAWRQMATGPIVDDELDIERRETFETLQRMGLATRAQHHPAQVTVLSEPWLKSPLHEVVYALLQRVAEQNHIEIIFIKGPTLFAQGIRAKEHSGDVDCWVAPGDDLRLARAMVEWGWEPLMLPFSGTGVTHSLTLRPGAWGCEIDVHTRFPGIGIDAPSAFRIVRDASESRVFASTACLTPARAPHAIISALHEVRPSRESSRPVAAARAAATAALRHGEGEVIPLARQLQTGHALAESLREAFPERSFTLGDMRPPRDWVWRGTRGALRRNMRGLSLVPAKMMPRVLWRLIWPSRATLLVGSAKGESTAGRLAAARLRRITTVISIAANGSRAGAERLGRQGAMLLRRAGRERKGTSDANVSDPWRR